ncbi:hypothetical protein JCM11491_006107 [Sporobolomyces phaffii]
MSEPVVFEGSPLAEYLQGLDDPEVPVSHDDRLEVEHVKYLLATSALLSPTLPDALQLYPPAPAPAAAPARSIAWPQGWDSFGETWRDRDALSNARHLWTALWPTNSYSIEPISPPSQTTSRQVEAFVDAAHALDRTIAHLSLNDNDDHDDDLVARELRRLVDLYRTATVRVSSLLPATHVPVPLPVVRTTTHRPTASLSELHRHATRALEERHEVEQWTASTSRGIPPLLLSSPLVAGDSPPPPSPRPRPLAPVPVVDPFHPTATFFGGLDRKSSTRSNPAAATTPAPSMNLTHTHERTSSGTVFAAARGRHDHRLWPPSIAAAASPPAASSLRRREKEGRAQPASSPRTRPKSMGGWIESTTTTTMTRGEQDESSSESRRTWESAHQFRKGFIWTLIAVLEEQRSGTNDDDPEVVVPETRAVLDDVTAGLERISASLKADDDVRRPGRRRTEIATPPRLAEARSPTRVVRPPQPPRPRSSSSSSASPSSTRHPDFGPPSDSPSADVRALAEYETRHVALVAALESVRRSLDAVRLDLDLVASASSSHEREEQEEEEEEAEAEATTIERLLGRHDSIKLDLEHVAREWTESRIAVRQAVQRQRQRQRHGSLSLGAAGVPNEDDDVVVVPDELNEDDPRPEPEPEPEERYASLDDGQSPDDDREWRSRQAIVDAALSSSFRPTLDDDAHEQVFEAVVVAGDDAGGRRGGRGSGGTRDERVRRMKEAREALDLGKKAAGAGGGLEAQQRMVGELRQVLKGLAKS